MNRLTVESFVLVYGHAVIDVKRERLAIGEVWFPRKYSESDSHYPFCVILVRVKTYAGWRCRAERNKTRKFRFCGNDLRNQSSHAVAHKNRRSCRLEVGDQLAVVEELDEPEDVACVVLHGSFSKFSAPSITVFVMPEGWRDY